MNFVKEKIKDFYLLDAKIENIFINEYMPGAPGDYVKVYIYASMYAEYELGMTLPVMAKQLGIPEEKINEAWTYWESLGAIRKNYFDGEGKFDYTVEFVNLKELMYGKNTTFAHGEQAERTEENIFGSEAVRNALKKIEETLGRSLSSSEAMKIIKWFEEDHVTPEIAMLGTTYCAEKGKTSIQYIDKVVKDWSLRGLETEDELKEYLQQVDERHYRYRRIMKALGFNRNATEAEREMMDRWFDGFGYNMDRVLEACTKTSGISSPNFNYVNRVLENWETEAKRRGNDVNKKVVVTQTVLNQYYDYLRNKAEKDAASRKEEVYGKFPRIKEIDDEVTQMGAQISKTMLLGDEERSKILKQKMDMLMGERAVVLTENNYEMDYTDIKYVCAKCNDTGITDLGERCSCIKQRTDEAEIWMKKKDQKF